MVYLNFQKTLKYLLKLKAKHKAKKKQNKAKNNCMLSEKDYNPQPNHNPTLTEALTLTLAASYLNTSHYPKS